MLYPYIAVALIAAILSGSGVWKVQSWRYAAKEKERQEEVLRQIRIAEKRVDVAAESHEKDKQRIRTEFVTITETVEKIIEKPFYIDGVCLDDDGLRELARAIAPSAAAGEPARAVPRPERAD